jgi:predicted membrane-bound spermidine synthase
MTVRAYAKLCVIFAGVVGLGIELAAERLMAPAFGTTLDLWSTIIGLTFTFLSLGYAVGGRLIDRAPTHRLMSLCLLVAGAWSFVIALVGRWVTFQVQDLTFDNGGVRAGVFLTTLLLFSVPPFVLGIITPAAVRLVVTGVGAAGSSTGTVYALGTLGSIAGTFLPVIVLIPRIGVRNTFILMGIIAVVVGGIGLTRWVAAPQASASESVAAAVDSVETADHPVDAVRLA